MFKSKNNKSQIFIGSGSITVAPHQKDLGSNPDNLIVKILKVNVLLKTSVPCYSKSVIAAKYDSILRYLLTLPCRKLRP